MAQRPNSYPIDPNTTSGTDLATLMNEDEVAESSNHSGNARPAYLTAGGIWTQTVAGGTLNLMMYDGTNDVRIGDNQGNNIVSDPKGGAAQTIKGALNVSGNIDNSNSIYNSVITGNTLTFTRSGTNYINFPSSPGALTVGVTGGPYTNLFANGKVAVNSPSTQGIVGAPAGASFQVYGGAYVRTYETDAVGLTITAVAGSTAYMIQAGAFIVTKDGKIKIPTATMTAIDNATTIAQLRAAVKSIFA